MKVNPGLVFTDKNTKEKIRLSMIEVEKVERVINYQPKVFFDYEFTLFDGRKITVAESEVSKYLYDKSKDNN